MHLVVPFAAPLSDAGRSALRDLSLPRLGALWPLLGWRNQEGVSRQSYYLWPFIYKKTTGLDTPAPLETGGVLPFYSYERGPELQSETWAWPFFGYLDRTAPYRYSEVRYFWPLFVQGAGTDRERSRWAPSLSAACSHKSSQQLRHRPRPLRPGGFRTARA